MGGRTAWVARFWRRCPRLLGFTRTPGLFPRLRGLVPAPRLRGFTPFPMFYTGSVACRCLVALSPTPGIWVAMQPLPVVCRVLMALSPRLGFGLRSPHPRGLPGFGGFVPSPPSPSRSSLPIYTRSPAPLLPFRRTTGRSSAIWRARGSKARFPCFQRLRTSCLLRTC